jgi:lipopolysaccharide/colanic/teichoic acid biosynthesis glycosyltransferase
MDTTKPIPVHDNCSGARWRAGDPALRGRRVRANDIARRALDVVLAVVALIGLAPLLLVIALVIWLDCPGPILFRQRRLGRDLRPFTVHKFRTMKTDADPEPHREYVRNLIGGARNSPGGAKSQLYKLAVDDRITRVGRVLRRLSLDECPQLWDVVRGHMSLVGPRPVIPYEVEHYPGWYAERFAVKPGITGLWQVSGRNERTYEEMVRFDVQYVQHESLRLYIAILFRTPWVVLRRQGAA